MMSVTGPLRIHKDTGKPKPLQEQACQRDRYRYVSGLVRAMELRLLDQARLNRILDANQPEDISRILAECGYPAGKNPEEILAAEAVSSLEWLRQIMPEPACAAALIVFHDGHNMKLVLKRLLTIWISGSEAEKLPGQKLDMGGQTGRQGKTEEAVLPNFGGLNGIPPFGNTVAQALRPAQVDPDVLYHQIAEHRSDALPEWIFLSAVEAVRRYLIRYDVSAVDAYLDQVAWQRAHLLAAQANNPFLTGWLVCKTDLINLEMLLRTRTMRTGREMLGNALLPGGSVRAPQVLDLYGDSKDAIMAFYAKTPYASLAEYGQNYEQQGQAAQYGLLADNLLMEHIRRARWIINGPEVPLAWVLARQAEIKNVRIILTCLRNALPKIQARNLIRDSYLAWR